MKKILYGLIGIMVVTGVIALGYSITRPQEPEAENVAYDDSVYPSELRPTEEGVTESNVTYDPDILLDSEELLPDENFTEFEIEEEETEDTEAPEETLAGEDEESAETTEPAEPEDLEDAPTANPADPPTKETLPAGSQVIINRKSNMRVGPDSRQKILEVLYADDIGEMVEAGENWSLINCREKQGYVYNSCWDIYTPPAE